MNAENHLRQKRVFLSYARAEVNEVSAVAAKLRARGLDVFFDVKSTQHGRYPDRIKEAVWNCDLFVFFVSANSLHEKSYARNELGYAETRWADPSDQVLAVRASDFRQEMVPAYLSAVTSIQPVDGNFATGVYDLVLQRLEQLARAKPARAKPVDELTISECGDSLAEALSRRRRLPPSGASTSEVIAEVDALTASIRSRFRPEEDSVVAGARLVKVIGVGNFGTVWEGVDVDTGLRVAVKIFRLERLAEGQMLFRFKKSIRAMRILSEGKRLSR